MKKKVLGKGLDALLPKEPVETNGITTIPIDMLKPNESQPRKQFSEHSIEELASSIREKGIIQPLLVRKKENYYEIIAGERRWRASQRAGLKQLPVIIKDISDSEALQIGLIENLQREDLNPLEEAQAYEKLISDFHMTHEEIAKKIGKNRSTITNQLRLLKLTEEAKSSLLNNKISSGHARALLALDEEEKTNEILRIVIEKNLSVRQTEALVKKIATSSKRKAEDSEQKIEEDTIKLHILHLEEELKKTLGTNVSIKHRGQKGKIEIEYYSNDELQRLIGILSSNR